MKAPASKNLRDLAFFGGVPICAEAWPLWPPISNDRDLVDRLARVLRSRQWTIRCHGDGESQLHEAEATWASRCGVQFALGVSSGSVALELSLRALQITAGDEVIVPSVGWYATAAAVCKTGATPVFADVDLKTSCMDAKSAREKITSRTKAIIVVHLHSGIAAMNEFERLSNSTGIPLIEDAAQAAGGKYLGRNVGSFGVFGCFSFNQEKQLAIGEGGAIVTNRRDYYESVFALRTDGYLPKSKSSPYFVANPKIMGGNAVMSEFAAAIWHAQAKDFDEQNLIRNRIGSQLSDVISETGIAIPLESSTGTDLRPWYEFGFRITHSDLAKWPLKLQAEVLSAELGIDVHPTDEPVQTCGQLGAIDWGNAPPVAIELTNRLLVFHHRFLLEERVTSAVPAALRKVSKVAETVSDIDSVVALKKEKLNG